MFLLYSLQTELSKKGDFLDGLGERLKKCRKQKHLLQQDAAEMLGIGYSTYRRYEQGGRGPSFDDAAKMAQLFHVSLDWLAGLTDDPSQPDPRVL